MLVEGWTDRDFLKNYINGNKIKVQKIGEGEGKKEIIQRITNDEEYDGIEYYGIVDMDYDFETSELILKKYGIELKLPNISDTNPKCNLFSFNFYNNYVQFGLLRSNISFRFVGFLIDLNFFQFLIP